MYTQKQLNMTLADRVKCLGNGRFRFFVKQADNNDREQRKDKARYDLIESPESKLLPNEDGYAADDNTGKNAVARCAAPEQRTQKGRTERGAETGPCIRDHVKDKVVRIEAEENRHARNDKNGHAADPDKFALRSVLVHERMIKILCKS